MNIVEKMKTDWDRRSAHNAKFWADVGQYQNDEVFNRAGENTVAKFLDVVAPFMKPPWHVLDVGCGVGRMIKSMASHFEHITGVDVSREMVLKAREWLRNVNNAEIFENSGVDLKPFESSRFDLVYSCIAFQHMPREVFENYLSEINRVLKPGGFLEFQMFVGSYSNPSFEDTLTLRIYEENELIEKLENHSFALVAKSVQATESEVGNSWILLARKVDEIKSVDPLSWLEKDLNNKPSRSEIKLWFQLANDYKAKGSMAEAEETLRYALTEHPRFLEVWLELSVFLVERGRPEDAIQTLKDMLSTHPTFYSGYFSLAELMKNSGHHEDIIDVQNRLREYQKDISQVLHNIENLLRGARPILPT